MHRSGPPAFESTSSMSMALYLKTCARATLKETRIPLGNSRVQTQWLIDATYRPCQDSISPQKKHQSSMILLDGGTTVAEAILGKVTFPTRIDQPTEPRSKLNQHGSSGLGGHCCSSRSSHREWGLLQFQASTETSVSFLEPSQLKHNCIISTISAKNGKTSDVRTSLETSFLYRNTALGKLLVEILEIIQPDPNI